MAMPEPPIEPVEPLESLGPSAAALPSTDAATGSPPATAEAIELIALIDRLEGVLERSGLAELEVGSGATTIVLRSVGVGRTRGPARRRDGACGHRTMARPRPRPTPRRTPSRAATTRSWRR